MSRTTLATTETFTNPTTGTEYRGVVEYDEYPSDPYFEAGFPILRVRRSPVRWSGYKVEDAGYTGGHDGLVETVRAVLENSIVTHGISKGTEMWARWLRVFHGGKVLAHDTGDGVTYLAFSTDSLYREWGLIDSKPDPEMEDWIAYTEGEVFSIHVERREVGTETVTYRDAGGAEVRTETREVDRWVEIGDTYCGGYYGRDWAVTEAAAEAKFYAATHA